MEDAVGPSDAKVGIVAGSRRIKQRGSGYFKRKHSRHVPQDDDAVIAQALNILSRRIRHNDFLASPADVRDFLRVLLADREHEILVVVLLDAKNRVLFSEELFRGTLTQTSVYSREVVKLALMANAGAVIFAHNHPSGDAQPSQPDKLCLTLTTVQ